MKTVIKLIMLESAFFFLLASIITFSLIGWRQLALFLSAVVAVAGYIALDNYYKYVAGCGSLSAKISLMPIIALLALTAVMISFRQHPFLMAALFILLFVLVVWKIAMLFDCVDRAVKRGKE